MRACDCCRRRKIKCDGAHPCEKCQTVQLVCTYNDHPQKMGPKRRKDSVIEELRTNKKLKEGDSGENSTEDQSSSPRRYREDLPSWSRFSKVVLQQLLEEYFKNLHLITPVLNSATVLKYLDTDPSYTEYCLVTGMCSYVLLVKPPTDTADKELSSELFADALWARDQGSFIDHISVDSIMATFFIFTAYYRDEKFEKAWFLLRETLTMAQIMGVHSESHYKGLDKETDLQHRILFYTLFITERGVALQTKFPLTLQNSISYPLIDSNKNHTYVGLIQLATLFTVVDDYQKLTQEGKTNLDVENLAKKLLDRLDATKQLTLNMKSDIQRADFFISLQWLKLLVWKLCRYSQAPHLQARILVDMADDINNLRQTLSEDSLEIHGVGMVMKLNEILEAIEEIQGLSIIPVNLVSTVAHGDTKEQITRILDLIGTFRDYEEIMYFKSLDTLTTSIDLAAFDTVSNLFDIFQQDDESTAGQKLLDV
jgi:Fungal Zn(2)-Cys(6) binuclear cluster domain